MDCYCLVGKQVRNFAMCNKTLLISLSYSNVAWPKIARKDASQHCHDNQMQLLSIESQEENEFITDLVSKNKDVIPNQFWIGGYNANLDPNKWVWQRPNLNTTNHLTYKNWCHGEPDNRSKNENFMAVINNCWHDVPGNFNWSSVCKRESKWKECPSHIGPSTKCFSNSKMDCYCLVSKKVRNFSVV